MSLYKPTRKAHTKSRLGCQECKRRHVKCNEARPSCANCSNTAKVCVYRSPPSRTTRSSSVPTPRRLGPPAAATRVGSARSATTAPSPASVGAITSTPSNTGTPENDFLGAPTTPSAQHSALFPPLNVRHMELFSHFIFQTAPSFYDGAVPDLDQLPAMMPAMLSFEYVMYEILALAALHLSHTEPGQAAYHREEATALQTRALSLFNDAGTEATAETCLPMLVFSSFLGLHTLAEAVTASKNDGIGFLDKFVTYLNLHRGVRLVTGQAWELLSRSRISPMLKRAEHALERAQSQPEQGQATLIAERLKSLLDDANMEPSSKQACRDAVSQLQLVYQYELHSGQLPREEQAPGLIWAWPTMLPGTFTRLLMERRPEALIVLCYYAVLLHRRRRMWLVGDAGQRLIEEMSRFLGTYWREYLEWPNQMLEEEPL